MRVKIGVQVRPMHVEFAAMRRAWRDAEELGVDTIFTWDHFFPLRGDPRGNHVECMAAMASMAEVTERAEIGALVCCNSYRNPELLADAHRTIDHISGGRVILGVGAGWFQRDYDEYGYEFGTAPDRGRALGEALPRIRSRLDKLVPPPLRRMPILIGGSGPKVTLRLVAEHADAWHSFGDAEAFREKDGILREHCARVGRNSDEIERTWGAPSDAAGADALVDAGVQHIIQGLDGHGPRYDLGPLRELVQWRDARGE
jgi:probable F420-dependent oxidoreductase